MRRSQLLTLIALLIVLVAASAVWISREIPRRLAEEATTPKEKEIDLGAVVMRIRGLNRLETTTMHVMHISTITQSYEFVPNSLSGDSLTFMATGDVIAGVDLALLKRNDVYRQPDGTVVVHLPPPQVLVTRIDNRESRVINRKTGFLRRSDNGLEGRARMFAESGVRNEAIKRGILNLAGQNAQARLAELLHSAGAEKVEFVETKAGPARTE